MITKFATNQVGMIHSEPQYPLFTLHHRVLETHNLACKASVCLWYSNVLAKVS